MSSKSEWTFNLRTNHYVSDSSDSDSEDVASLAKDTSSTLLDEVSSFASRDNGIVYKPNPFSIAKINAASRARAPSAAAAKSGCGKEEEKLKRRPSGRIVDGFKRQAEKAAKSAGTNAGKGIPKRSSKTCQATLTPKPVHSVAPSHQQVEPKICPSRPVPASGPALVIPRQVHSSPIQVPSSPPSAMFSSFSSPLRHFEPANTNAHPNRAPNFVASSFPAFPATPRQTQLACLPSFAPTQNRFTAPRPADTTHNTLKSVPFLTRRPNAPPTRVYPPLSRPQPPLGPTDQLSNSDTPGAYIHPNALGPRPDMHHPTQLAAQSCQTSHTSTAEIMVDILHSAPRATYASSVVPTPTVFAAPALHARSKPGPALIRAAVPARSPSPPPPKRPIRSRPRAEDEDEQWSTIHPPAKRSKPTVERTKKFGMPRLFPTRHGKDERKSKESVRVITYLPPPLVPARSPISSKSSPPPAKDDSPSTSDPVTPVSIDRIAHIYPAVRNEMRKRKQLFALVWIELGMESCGKVWCDAEGREGEVGFAVFG